MDQAIKKFTEKENKLGLESNFQSSALKYLNGLPGCKAENVSGNASQSGRPDINGCFRGRMFKLELKTPDNRYKASTKQKLELRRCFNCGCVVGVIYSMNSLSQMFNEIWESDHMKTRYILEENQCESWYKIPLWRT